MQSLPTVGSVWIEKQKLRGDMKKEDVIKHERARRRLEQIRLEQIRLNTLLAPPTDPQIYLLIMNDLPPATTYGEANAYISLLESDEDV